jgi:hypothetical protein
VFGELKHIPEAWSRMFHGRSFRNQFFITLMVFVLVNMHNFHYLRLWQARHGVQINDVVLNQLPPHDFSSPIFFIEYGTLLLGVLFLLPFPDRFIKGLQMASIVIVARTMSIYFIALEPPRDMIPLNDPVATFFLHTKQVFVSKDLFFSGHIAILSLLCFVVLHKYVKAWTVLATITVGTLILWQHVHYSLDVFAAPFVSFAAYKFVLYIHRETRYGMNLKGQKNTPSYHSTHNDMWE